MEANGTISKKEKIIFSSATYTTQLIFYKAFGIDFVSFLPDVAIIREDLIRT